MLRVNKQMLSGDLWTSPCLWFCTKQEIVSGGCYAPDSLSMTDSMVKADRINTGAVAGS